MESVAADPRPWSTVRAERSVLGIVHNITSATRLVDLLAAFRGDLRVETFFTCTGSSALDGGTADYLTSRGMIETPWESAKSETFDLAIATSRGGDLHDLRTPLIGAPHGAGYNKRLSREPGAFGLTSEWLMHNGRVIPSVIVLSHEEQRERLRTGCPEAVPVSVVVGDPCMDQLRASLPLRESYRRALGLLPGQKLIVVSSTWGPESVLGFAEAEAFRRVLAELPADEFRAIAAVHPNAWYGHGSWQLHRWLAPLLDLGLLLPDPDTEAWKAALVAADFLIGDHGSVTLYGAALGVPSLLGSFSASSVAPDSPMERLGQSLPRLTSGPSLLSQLATAAATQQNDPALQRVAAEVTSVPGESASRLRGLFYEQLKLPEPPAPAVTSLIPLPALPHRTSQPPLLPAMFVSTSPSTGEVEGDMAAVIRRFPAELQRSDLRHLSSTHHLAADSADPDPRWAANADVLLVPHRRLPADAVPEWSSLARNRPGASLVAVEESAAGCLALLPDGRRLRAEWLLLPAWASFAVAASVVHDCMYSFTPPSELQVRVAAGPEQDEGLLLITPL